MTVKLNDLTVTAQDLKTTTPTTNHLKYPQIYFDLQTTQTQLRATTEVPKDYNESELQPALGHQIAIGAGLFIGLALGSVCMYHTCIYFLKNFKR